MRGLAFQGGTVFETGFPWRRSCAAAVLLSLLAGCQQPLAVNDPYFRPGNTTAAAERDRVDRVLLYGRALRAAGLACRDGAGRRDGRAEAGLAAPAVPCAASPKPPPAALGGTANAYRRWVEDRVRELPEAAATAAGAAGGS